MNPDLEKDYEYHRRQCEKLSKEIWNRTMKPLEIRVMQLSAEFIPSEERELLNEITYTKERAEVFLNHIRTIYAEELQKRRDEQEAIRAELEAFRTANPLPPVRVKTIEEEDAYMAEHHPLLYKRILRRRALGITTPIKSRGYY